MKPVIPFLLAAPMLVPALAFAKTEAPAGLPAEYTSKFQAFAARCSQCHEPERAYKARYVTEKQWQGLVSRMARKPGAAITGDDQKKIIAYLTWYASRSK